MYLVSRAKITLKDSTKGQSSYFSNEKEKPKNEEENGFENTKHIHPCE